MNIYEYPKPRGSSWIILESLNTEHFSDEQAKVLHIFTFTHKSSLIIGRGYKADAKISDISISRVHAYLKNLDNEIWIQDAGSKFGCLFLQ